MTDGEHKLCEMCRIKHADRANRIYHRRRRLKLCADCGVPGCVRFARCESCRVKRTQRQLKYQAQMTAKAAAPKSRSC